MDISFVMISKMPIDEVNKDVTHVESIDPQHAIFENIILMTFLSEM